MSRELELENSNRASLKRELETVKEEIRVLQRIGIYVYENGVIEAEGGKLLPEVDSEEIFMKLVVKDSVEDLTTRQIKQVAKAIAIVRVLVSSDVDVMFENDELQAVFEREKGVL